MKNILTTLRLLLFIIVLVTISGLTGTGFCEQRPLLTAAGDSDRIILRWVWPQGGLYAPLYKIYRQELGSGQWELITPKPITKVKDRDMAQKILGEEMYQKYQHILFLTLPDRKKNPAKFQEAILRMKDLWGMTMLSADLYPPLATLLGVRYEDFSAKEKTPYIYRLVIAGDQDDELVGISLPVSVGEPYISPPQGMQGKADDGIVLLRWQIEPRFSAYDVYRSDTKEGKYKKVNGHPVVILQTYDEHGKVRVPDWFYVDRDLENGHTYWYTLWGRDPFGRFSRIPRPIALTPKDMTPPIPVLGFKTEVKQDEVTLSWEQSSEEDCKGYHLYRSLNYKDGFERITKKPVKSKTLSYIDKDLKTETIYWYYVTAVDASGNESGRSYTAPANVRDWVPPKSPRGLSGEVEPGKVLLAWKANQEEDLVGYRIYQSMSIDAEYYHRLQLEPVVGAAFEQVLPKTASTNPYFYKITAVDRSGNESDFSKIIKIKLPDVTPPFPPVFATTKITEGEITVLWHPNREADLAGYELYRQEKGDSAGTTSLHLNKKLLPVKTLSFKDADNLVVGIRYLYTLKAVDKDGNVSLLSCPVVAATFDHTPPKAPSSIKGKQVKKEQTVTVTWKLPTAKDLKGVILYRAKKAGGTFYPLTQMVKESNYIDTKVKFGKTYYYRLVAFDLKNNKSEDSKIVTVEVKRPK